MKVPLLDLKSQYQSIKTELDDALAHIIESQQFVLGQAVEECEKSVAEYCGTSFGCGVSSGTDALLIALMAENVGPGDEVITTPYSFFATAGSIVRAGARPVFVDIDADTYNIDVSKIEARINKKTKAIMPVHLYGQLADIEKIVAIARAANLTVIEDAAQAIGAENQGVRAGAFGDYGCFSFFPSKNLGCFGDGGMVVSNDEARITKLKKLRNHGMDPKYYHKLVGGNFRLDALQAAVVRVKLKHLDAWSAKRAKNAALYNQLFQESGLSGSALTLPAVKKTRHIFNQYVIRVHHEKRDGLFEYLKSKEIGSDIYYPVPLHLQECFRELGYREGDFPVSESASRETLALPIYPELSEEAQQTVVKAIREFL